MKSIFVLVLCILSYVFSITLLKGEHSELVVIVTVTVYEGIKEAK